MRLMFLCLLCCVMPIKALADDLVVFAAASLKGPLDAIAADFGDVVVSYGGSGTLARQVSQGAPADVVLLANAAWMDVLVADEWVATAVPFVGNALVIVGQPDADEVALTPDGLTTALGGGRIAMGFTNSVPAGIYGKVALEALGLWETVAPRVVEVDNVRAALNLVARGEVPIGVVYQSDALIVPELEIVARFPRDSHPEIAYFAGVTAQATHPKAAKFIAFLGTEAAQKALSDAGFCTDRQRC
ncbi:molybdate transport system substrate-binding protein [Loktanella ponticola]|uniref:Molybdate transport system substrate-binding protein n=1 Tax=Yoonia ponticola TaxID=1524255 RepID=A0A7W9BI56_9RHOB|nr:molybdate ABC transporter substrate-binding protein [Yoonia ponticola]MBB5720964.1 molybdate transport system substrate-binding protein [Yoonia ponticola]